MIIDFTEVFQLFSSVSYMRLARRYYTPSEIIQSLIEQPLTPHEVPLIIDDIAKIIEKDAQHKEYPNSDIYSTLDALCMTMESLQVMVDNLIISRLPANGHIDRYEVTKWLSPSCALISITPIQN